MEHRDGLLHEFVDGFVGTALDVLFNQLFKFGPKAYFHGGILTHAAVSITQSPTLSPAPSTSHRPAPESSRPSRSPPARDARSPRSTTCAWHRCPSLSRSSRGVQHGRANRRGPA